MKKIVLASNNKHKIVEFKLILDNYEILTLDDIGFTEDIEEDGSTFLENALIKARTVSKYLKEKGLDYDILADDSGTVLESLNGAPGIHSARYAGDHDIKANRKKLIADLKGKDHHAYFNSTIVLYHPDGTYIYKEGRSYGTIIEEERGDTSFGYECIFLSDDLNKTFGEATREEKNRVSHRGKALAAIKEELDKN
ncbi:MAG: RdgB/HAM1 family non-canonical purine NTP pyrophosphatase [Bacilli bacterium]|nr:RdgB/HAM1 family non-canonical purine NTP pyrophosphatase [Bacilli bacterium]